MNTWKYFRIVQYFVDYYTFKESGEMGSKLCTGTCLTWDFPILLYAQVVDSGPGEGSLWRRGFWHTPSFAGYLQRLVSLSVFPRELWNGGFMPITLVLLVSKHFHGENGHARMPRANDLWLLRMFWIFKQEWYLGWISIWLLLLLEFLLYFQKASSFLLSTRYFLWFLCFCGQIYNEGNSADWILTFCFSH